MISWRYRFDALRSQLSCVEAKRITDCEMATLREQYDTLLAEVKKVVQMPMASKMHLDKLMLTQVNDDLDDDGQHTNCSFEIKSAGTLHKASLSFLVSPSRHVLFPSRLSHDEQHLGPSRWKPRMHSFSMKK
jgi:hypothetical protein